MSRNLFDPQDWQEIIKKPDWYGDITRLVDKVRRQYGERSKESDQFNKQLRHFFEAALEDGRVALANSGPDLDASRQTVDTLVIHHTSAEPGYRLSYMNATHLLNIYAPYYLNPTVKAERGLKGQAIWSGHFKDSRQTFLAYHWLMRMDGSFERLLDDDKIAWHAGNWGVNRRSIGICLDNDYESRDPDEKLLTKLAEFINTNYSFVTPGKIIGHCEAREGIICPGANFLTTWKPKLIDYVKHGRTA